MRSPSLKIDPKMSKNAVLPVQTIPPKLVKPRRSRNRFRLRVQPRLLASAQTSNVPNVGRVVFPPKGYSIRLWIHIDIHRNPWRPIVCPWIINWYPWICIDVHGMSVHEVSMDYPWISMGYQFKFMYYPYSIVWDQFNTQDYQWISMINIRLPMDIND